MELGENPKISVHLFKTEYEELIEKYGPEKANEMIELLNNYKDAHGKKYKSDYHAILQWVAQEVTGNKKRLVRHEKELDFRQREIALTRWIEEGNDPNDFT